MTLPQTLYMLRDKADGEFLRNYDGHGEPLLVYTDEEDAKEAQESVLDYYQWDCDIISVEVRVAE